MSILQMNPLKPEAFHRLSSQRNHMSLIGMTFLGSITIQLKYDNESHGSRLSCC